MTTGLLSVQEAADKLGVSRQYVLKLCTDKRMGKKVGTFWVITAAEVAAYKASSLGKPGRPRKKKRRKST